jgi:hypothetical protein
LHARTPVATDQDSGDNFFQRLKRHRPVRPTCCCVVARCLDSNSQRPRLLAALQGNTDPDPDNTTRNTETRCTSTSVLLPANDDCMLRRTQLETIQSSRSSATAGLNNGAHMRSSHRISSSTSAHMATYGRHESEKPTGARPE